MFSIIFIIIIIDISNEINIKNGVYDFLYKNMYFNYENNTLQISNFLQEEINSYFRITKISDINTSFHYIEHVNTKLNLIISHNNNHNIILQLINKTNEFAYWNFINISNNNFIIQNKNKCYIKIKKLNISCENITLNEASHFNLIKIYDEVNENKYDNELIEKEPIDVLIKYIDLRDPFLIRKGIHQIKKDIDNEELRYSIRCIIKNIPWVRKIFILMPNVKVKYFKDYNYIKDKIIYIQDKQILGGDSSNSLAFQFRFWKLQNFGISHNFIVMDDDYFIGHPLNKSDFFYVTNGKVKPAIISYKFKKLDKKSAKQRLDRYTQMIKDNNLEQNSPIFRYSLYSTYLFILKLFGESLYVPAHTHNAIPVNLKELREIYNIVFQSEYKYGTLDCTYRTINNLQFQTFVVSYSFFKYKKKIKNISNKLINNKNTIISDYNYSLFCINTGSFNYSIISFMISKIVMEYLFPIPTPYEINNNSNFSLLVFNAIYTIEKEIKYYLKKNNNRINILENELSKYHIKKIYLGYIKLLIILLVLINLKKIKIIKDD